MTLRAPVLGWLGAATTAAALLTGAMALAITAMPPQPVMLDLGQSPPAAPSIVAIANFAPQVVDEAPALDTPPAPLQEPLPPTALAAPAVHPVTPQIALPKPDVLAQSDIAVPVQHPPSRPAANRLKPQRQAKAETPEPQPKPTTKRQNKHPAKPAASAGSTAPQKGQKAKSGAPKVSAAAYAKAVMKKVRATKKKSGAGKGKAVIGFTVARNGGLAGVRVLQSSGNAALDQIAVSHIQRSAPFPVPPEGAGRSFSFEFVGK